MTGDTIEDLLDRLVADFSDRLAAGSAPPRSEVLAQAPPDARPGLERCLKMIEAGMARAPRSPNPTPGSSLGRYRLLHEIGRGGMARVFLARDEELRRPVALKLLRPGLALEERHVDRFRREALAVAKLKHPHVVQIHDVGESDGHHYLAMEFVEGPSLATVLQALPRSRRPTSADLARATGVPALEDASASFEAAVARLLAPIAGALHAAHGLGLVHRDVKPSNILIHRDGRPVIADFGLAKGEGDPALSLTGDAIGTPHYMSPEQARLTRAKIDHRTDVYSLGVTLYEALSGVRPFEGETALEVLESIRSRIPPSLRSVAPHASRDAAAVVRRAMAHDPEDRYASAAALEADLRALAEGRLTEARQREGGAWRRFRAHVGLYATGQLEYRSRRTFLGLPLVHVVARRRSPGEPLRVAKGWFAAGDVAIGGLACGGVAAGGIAFGGLSAGLLFGMGGLATGAFVFAGMGIGVVSFSGIALGWLALGGCALGYAALGGYARGVYSLGGHTAGPHAIAGESTDPVSLAWFQEHAAWALHMIGGS